jgi:hypothetical protein
MFRKEILLRMAAIEQEWRAATLAVAELARRALDDPTSLRAATVTHADVRACLANLQPTYLVRMFASFEEALREVWRRVYARTTRPETYVLIQRCAVRQNVPFDELANAQAVREYRNVIVHGGEAPPIPPEARTALCKFFGRMPPQW